MSLSTLATKAVSEGRCDVATTSIWRVKGWLGKVVIYAENPDKTENPKYFEQKLMTGDETQGLSDVIDYAVNDEKTHNKDSILDDEDTPVMERFVSGVNCLPENARSEMLKTKKQFGKDGGVVAYHGYQSFAPGECSPEQAHEIGIKLAEKLWGAKYQVLVTTHLDKEHHIHNHFVVNSVSFVDGIRYYRSERDYYNMRKESDALCREYGLSVIPNAKEGGWRHYAEWKDEKAGKPTFRSLVKIDVDTAIRQSMTERQFFDALHKMGYEVKTGKYFAVKAPGKDRFYRLPKNLGEDYTLENIRKRILAQSRPERKIIPPDPPPRKARLIGTIHTARKLTGLRALYFYYLYRMGVLPKKRELSPKQVYFLFREDIRFIRNISKETRLLAEHRIETAEQLTAHKEGLTAKHNALYDQRKHLRYQSRSIHDEERLAAVKAEISALSDKIGELRMEVKLCEDIERRSGTMRENIRKAAEYEKSQEKELTKHEPFRRRR